MTHTARFWPEGRGEGCGPCGRRDAGQREAGRDACSLRHSDTARRGMFAARRAYCEVWLRWGAVMLCAPRTSPPFVSACSRKHCIPVLPPLPGASPSVARIPPRAPPAEPRRVRHSPVCGVGRSGDLRFWYTTYCYVLVSCSLCVAFDFLATQNAADCLRTCGVLCEWVLCYLFCIVFYIFVFQIGRAHV